jgi:gluconokinase
LARALHEAAGAKGVAVGACSALKRSYRDYLIEQAGEPVLFIFLQGTQEMIASRMAVRAHEYMPPSLLASQLATLEPPGPDENALAIPITLTVEQIAERALKAAPHLKSFKRKQ